MAWQRRAPGFLVLLLKHKTPRSPCHVDSCALGCIQQGAAAAVQVLHYELSCRDVELRHLVVFRHCEKLHLIALLDDGTAVHSDSPIGSHCPHLVVALLDDPNPEAIRLALSLCAKFQSLEQLVSSFRWENPWFLFYWAYLLIYILSHT